MLELVMQIIEREKIEKQRNERKCERKVDEDYSDKVAHFRVSRMKNRRAVFRFAIAFTCDFQ